MMRLLKVIGSLCSILYPFLILWILSVYRAYLRDICLFVLPVLVLLCIVQFTRTRQLKDLMYLLVATVLFAAVAITDTPDFFKLYPILVSALLLVHFAGSLVNPPTVIERFALLSRKGEPLPAAAVLYCRKVTKVWIGFFCFNILVSALTALSGNWEIWSWYNGFISYIIIGLLMGGEWLARRRVEKQ